MNDLRGNLFLMLIGLPLIATENLECRRNFKCLNTTHFNICGNFGDGKLRIIEGAIIPCPPGLVCKEINPNECHFPDFVPIIKTSTPKTVLETNIFILPNNKSSTTTVELDNTTTATLADNSLVISEKVNDGTAIIEMPLSIMNNSAKENIAEMVPFVHNFTGNFTGSMSLLTKILKVSESLTVEGAYNGSVEVGIGENNKSSILIDRSSEKSTIVTPVWESTTEPTFTDTLITLKKLNDKNNSIDSANTHGDKIETYAAKLSHYMNLSNTIPNNDYSATQSSDYTSLLNTHYNEGLYTTVSSVLDTTLLISTTQTMLSKNHTVSPAAKLNINNKDLSVKYDHINNPSKTIMTSNVETILNTTIKPTTQSKLENVMKTPVFEIINNNDSMLEHENINKLTTTDAKTLLQTTEHSLIESSLMNRDLTHTATTSIIASLSIPNNSTLHPTTDIIFSLIKHEKSNTETMLFNNTNNITVRPVIEKTNTGKTTATQQILENYTSNQTIDTVVNVTIPSYKHNEMNKTVKSMTVNVETMSNTNTFNLIEDTITYKDSFNTTTNSTMSNQLTVENKRFNRGTKIDINNTYPTFDHKKFNNTTESIKMSNAKPTLYTTTYNVIENYTIYSILPDINTETTKTEPSILKKELSNPVLAMFVTKPDLLLVQQNMNKVTTETMVVLNTTLHVAADNLSQSILMKTDLYNSTNESTTSTQVTFDNLTTDPSIEKNIYNTDPPHQNEHHNKNTVKAMTEPNVILHSTTENVTNTSLKYEDRSNTTTKFITSKKSIMDNFTNTTFEIAFNTEPSIKHPVINNTFEMINEYKILYNTTSNITESILSNRNTEMESYTISESAITNQPILENYTTDLNIETNTKKMVSSLSHERIDNNTEATIMSNVTHHLIEDSLGYRDLSTNTSEPVTADQLTVNKNTLDPVIEMINYNVNTSIKNEKLNNTAKGITMLNVDTILNKTIYDLIENSTISQNSLSIFSNQPTLENFTTEVGFEIMVNTTSPSLKHENMNKVTTQTGTLLKSTLMEIDLSTSITESNNINQSFSYTEPLFDHEEKSDTTETVNMLKTITHNFMKNSSSFRNLSNTTTFTELTTSTQAPLDNFAINPATDNIVINTDSSQQYEKVNAMTTKAMTGSNVVLHATINKLIKSTPKNIDLSNTTTKLQTTNQSTTEKKLTNTTFNTGFNKDASVQKNINYTTETLVVSNIDKILYNTTGITNASISMNIDLLNIPGNQITLESYAPISINKNNSVQSFQHESDVNNQTRFKNTTDFATATIVNNTKLPVQPKYMNQMTTEAITVSNVILPSTTDNLIKSSPIHRDPSSYRIISSFTITVTEPTIKQEVTTETTILSAEKILNNIVSTQTENTLIYTDISDTITESAITSPPTLENYTSNPNKIGINMNDTVPSLKYGKLDNATESLIVTKTEAMLHTTSSINLIERSIIYRDLSSYPVTTPVVTDQTTRNHITYPRIFTAKLLKETNQLNNPKSMYNITNSSNNMILNAGQTNNSAYIKNITIYSHDLSAHSINSTNQSSQNITKNKSNISETKNLMNISITDTSPIVILLTTPSLTYSENKNITSKNNGPKAIERKESKLEVDQKINTSKIMNDAVNNSEIDVQSKTQMADNSSHFFNMKNKTITLKEFAKDQIGAKIDQKSVDERVILNHTNVEKHNNQMHNVTYANQKTYTTIVKTDSNMQNNVTNKSEKPKNIGTTSTATKTNFTQRANVNDTKIKELIEYGNVTSTKQNITIEIKSNVNETTQSNVPNSKTAQTATIKMNSSTSQIADIIAFLVSNGYSQPIKLGSIHNGPKIPVTTIDCRLRGRGRYADNNDCKTFYVCIGKPYSIIKHCPVNTVFSTFRKQCTSNLSHCVRNNKFMCEMEGRFIDLFSDTHYYICVKNKMQKFVKFKFQCQRNFYLDKSSIRCIREAEITKSASISVDGQNKASFDKSSLEGQTVIKTESGFKCTEEGKFADSNSCRKYYVCTKKNNKLCKKRKKCPEDEVFHRLEKKCVSEESYECDD